MFRLSQQAQSRREPSLQHAGVLGLGLRPIQGIGVAPSSKGTDSVRLQAAALSDSAKLGTAATAVDGNRRVTWQKLQNSIDTPSSLEKLPRLARDLSCAVASPSPCSNTVPIMESGKREGRIADLQSWGWAVSVCARVN